MAELNSVNVAILASRLCVTAQGSVTHIAQPNRFRLTMCGAYRAVDYSTRDGELTEHHPPIPQGQRICRRCQAAFEWEVAA